MSQCYKTAEKNGKENPEKLGEKNHICVSQEQRLS